MTTFVDALTAVTNTTRTTNGALTNRSTLDPVVDFFATAGAMRDNPELAADLFERAFAVEPLTAVRTLFYFRDVRGGQGERDIFRAGLKRLDKLTGDVVTERWLNLLAHIPEYGRWDDLFELGINRSDVVQLINNQLVTDSLDFSNGEQVSLMAKWLPSENTSSKNTRKRAFQLRSALGLSSREYRKTLSGLRARIRLLEHQMSAGNWSEIDYGKLPSQAHRKHVKAFKRHDDARYSAYLDSVTKGEAKINVSTLFPYEIYDMVSSGPSYYTDFTDNQYADVAWANLPDYTNGTKALVMADVSGSMWGRPMSVSVSLALYFAERNEGVFKDVFMTFSAEPQLVKVKGNKLSTRMASIQKAQWGMNTNMLAAFRAILAASLRARELPPEVLYIVSDMQFDQASHGDNATIFQIAKGEYAAAGVKMPHVVFWNVNARDMQAPAIVLDGAVTLVSGSSPTVFGMAVQGLSPRELVDSVVNGERYERIVL